MGPGMWATSPGPRSHGRVASPYRLGVRRDTGVVTPRPAPRRLTPRGRVVLGLVGALLVVGSLAIARAVLHGPPDCTVRADGRTVDLDQRQAERAATWSTTSSGGRSAARLDASALARDLAISATDARAVVAAFTGRVPAAVTCRHGGAATSETDRLDSHGLTPRAEAVREDLRARFPGVPLGGFAPGGVHTGHMPGSAHYEGRAIDAFVRPVNPRNKERGWALAEYFVANAARLSINTVIFDDRIWTARRAADGWRHYTVATGGKPPAVVRILEHRDHVHVDVAD